MIIDIVESIIVPCTVMGDFNLVLYTNENLGGTPMPLSKLLNFKNYVFYCGLLDISNTRFHYTW